MVGSLSLLIGSLGLLIGSLRLLIGSMYLRIGYFHLLILTAFTDMQRGFVYRQPSCRGACNFRRLLSLPSSP